MDSLDIWNELRNLTGQTLKTLDQRKPFEIVAMTQSTIMVCPQRTGKARPIRRDGLQRAYHWLVGTGKLTLTEIENEFAPYNPVYVAAILAALPGVRYTTRPIMLHMTIAP